jgi:Fe-S oxidoreductase
MCNNNGHCRKFDAGTMCPSFRVTRDEMHLTRGRANTLRLALSGHLREDLGGDAVHDALDLCVSCKGCRRECPTGVDMARMKIEHRHRRRALRPDSLRDRLIATLPRWAPLAARAPALFNLPRHARAAAWLGERLLGLSARRALPRWRADTFLSRRIDDDADADVVLLVDTFTNAFEPENAVDALALLRAAGHRVAIARSPGRAPLCCGRTLLTAGRVDEARAVARDLVAALEPHAQRGATLVGLEPSCLFTLRDEWSAMGLGDRADRIALRARTIEELLAAEPAGRLPLRALPQSRALLHGHCHQKAFDALAPVVTLLRRVPGLTVDVVESSCCGMAGSFGYEAEHDEVSRAMAELSLLPAVRAAAPDTLIVAGGTSCRHQIADLAGREPLHPVRVLARALA